MVLLVLAAIWAAVLLPPYLQKRRAFHPSASVVDFSHQLAVLQRTGDPAALSGSPRSMTARSTMSRAEAMRRRRDVVATLTTAAVLTFLLAVALGGSVWLLHLTVDAALLGYVAMLMQIQQQRTQVRNTVRYLPAQHQSPTQQALLRRSAN